MIKNYIINKANVLIMCFILIGLFCFIPVNDEYIVVGENKVSSNIYLLDHDNYVSRVLYYFDESNIIDLIREKLMLLMNGIDNNFYPLIPKNTKINKIDVVRESVFIDFNESFLNVNEINEEEMIEAIVYSLCDINGIENIYLSVNGKEFRNLPNSNRNISYPLTKEFGINKEYNIFNFNDVDKTVVVFAKEIDDIIYYVPVTKIYNSSNEKVEVIIEELKSSINAQSGFIGYLNDEVKLIDYSIDENSLVMVFNSVINKEYEDFISLSIRENYKNRDIIYKYD